MPQTIINHLDDETAARLHAAIERPADFPPDFLDHTSIRGLHAVGPADSAKPDDAVWYDRSLPPVHLEVALIKYEWMLNAAIDRASRRIDEVTEDKVRSKIEEALFHWRCEQRILARHASP